jgi:hypothetical protein
LDAHCIHLAALVDFNLAFIAVKLACLFGTITLMLMR